MSLFIYLRYNRNAWLILDDSIVTNFIIKMQILIIIMLVFIKIFTIEHFTNLFPSHCYRAVYRLAVNSSTHGDNTPSVNIMEQQPIFARILDIKVFKGIALPRK